MGKRVQLVVVRVCTEQPRCRTPHHAATKQGGTGKQGTASTGWGQQVVNCLVCVGAAGMRHGSYEAWEATKQHRDRGGEALSVVQTREPLHPHQRNVQPLYTHVRGVSTPAGTALPARLGPSSSDTGVERSTAALPGPGAPPAPAPPVPPTPPPPCRPLACLSSLSMLIQW